MAKLGYIKATVIGGATGGKPNTDFPLPIKMVDYLIYQIAGQLLYEDKLQRGALFSVEDHMVTRFECLSVKLEEPVCLAGSDYCQAKYVIDLPFTPMDLTDDKGILSVFLQKYMIPVSYVSNKMIHLVKDSVLPPSYMYPHYYRIGSKLYLFGGDRDFTKCPILIDGVVGSLVEDTTCSLGENSNVAVPSHMEATLIDRVTKKIMQMIYGSPVDAAEDGQQTKDLKNQMI